MKIALVIYPGTEPTIYPGLTIVPRIGEKVFVGGKLYPVEDVYYNIDNNLIKVILGKP